MMKVVTINIDFSFADGYKLILAGIMIISVVVNRNSKPH